MIEIDLYITHIWTLHRMFVHKPVLEVAVAAAPTLATMMKLIAFVALIVVLVAQVVCVVQANINPEQVHLSAAQTPDRMNVMWVTQVGQPMVREQCSTVLRSQQCDTQLSSQHTSRIEHSWGTENHWCSMACSPML